MPKTNPFVAKHLRNLGTHAIGWTDGSNGSSKSTCGAAAYVLAEVNSREIIEERAQEYPHTYAPGEDVVKFTSNDMEMTGILLCLEAAKRTGVTNLAVRSDSQWSVNIITGEFVLRQAKFVSIVDEIREIGEFFREISIKHVPRERNARADWLCRGATGQKRKAHAPQICW